MQFRRSTVERLFLKVFVLLQLVGMFLMVWELGWWSRSDSLQESTTHRFYLADDSGAAAAAAAAAMAARAAEKELDTFINSRIGTLVAVCCLRPAPRSFRCLWPLVSHLSLLIPLLSSHPTPSVPFGSARVGSFPAPCFPGPLAFRERRQCWCAIGPWKHWQAWRCRDGGRSKQPAWWCSPRCWC